METIRVEVAWCDKNYSGGWSLEGVGAVLATGKSLEKFKEEFANALAFHIDSMVESGDIVPKWLVERDFVLQYELKTSALLREAERFTTMAVISRESGINQKQLSHYASNLKEPREPQRRKIIEGIHRIANSFMSLC